MAMLEVKDLQVYYGMIQAIKGISFEVNRGRGHCSDRSQRCRKDDNSAYHHRTACTESRIGYYLKEKISQRFRLIRSYPWEWHMYRKEDVFSQS